MKKATVVLGAAVWALIWVSGVWAGQAVSVVGTVLDTYQVQADDGTVYDIGDTEEGNKVLDMIGRKVKISGELEEDAEGMIIFVNSYEALDHQ